MNAHTLAMLHTIMRDHYTPDQIVAEIVKAVQS